MKKELQKNYNPAEIEERIYQNWLDKSYFKAPMDKKKKPFTIVMPPPNITGHLHMGHALDNTLQDILIRYKRMQGYSALWQAGTDHASISTEVKIIGKLAEEGTTKEELGRDNFLKKAWEWKKEYGGTIVGQLKRLGSSADWSRERFTMDEGCSEAVQHVFIDLYNKGYIYRGYRIINWCPECQTSISDAEVEHEEQEGHFWHIRYPIKDSDEFLEIATTRPETMLGDSGVAVHPEDERYTHLVGKTAILPLVGRELPIVADEYVDKDFGTGCVKMTPAHDPNDFEVGNRHNLEFINILGDDAIVNDKGGKYAGMDRYEARKAIVKDLEAQGYLIKIEKHIHNVGTHDRCNTTIEPMVKQQWFVAMKELAKPAIEAVRKGDMKIVPQRFDKIYYHWLENIKDWCISRQLWWGHRIPAYYCDKCGETMVSPAVPEECPVCGCSRLTQDEDVLDTWFSSALWPFSTLGWPEKTPEMDYFYPTDVLVTGYDIIFFWVIRMVFSALEQTGEIPFHTVLIHGLVRDSQGRKMSKSLGNGIDPLEVIDKYGADALRLTLITGNAPGNDMRFNWEKVEASRNFANKIWNASRFIMMNMEEKEIKEPGIEKLAAADRWILSRVNKLAGEVTVNMDHYDLGVAVQKVYDFAWDEFCDWYIEIVKPRLYQKELDEASYNSALWTLKTVLIQILKLLHPYIPFITEEIFTNLQTKESSIMVSNWPVYQESWNSPQEEDMFEVIKAAVRAIRNLRAEMNVPPSKRAAVYIVSEDESIRNVFESAKQNYSHLISAGEVHIQEGKEGISEDAVSVVIPKAVIYIPLEDLVDIEKERERLNKEKDRLIKELDRVNGMLSNEKFICKAPASKIEEEKEKRQKYSQMLDQVWERLKAIS